MRSPFANAVFVAVVQALLAVAHTQSVLSDSSKSWSEKYGSQEDLSYTGPLSFSHLPYFRCLEDASPVFDVAVLGMPFDTSVTYRPGARFGPTGIRVGSRRIQAHRAWSLTWGLDPYQQGLKIIDCGDVCVVLLMCDATDKRYVSFQVPLSPFDNALAIDQMEVAYSTLLQRDVARTDTEDMVGSTRPFAKDKKEHPKIVTYISSPPLHSVHCLSLH